MGAMRGSAVCLDSTSPTLSSSRSHYLSPVNFLHLLQHHLFSFFFSIYLCLLLPASFPPYTTTHKSDQQTHTHTHTNTHISLPLLFPPSLLYLHTHSSFSLLPFFWVLF